MKSRLVILGVTVGLSLSGASRADEPIYCPATGNYYEYVEQSGVVWVDAVTAAENSTFNGVVGHLLTVTSTHESECVTESSLLPPADPTGGNAVWVGGLQICDPPLCNEPGEGWMWITAEAMDWLNWCIGEPNNTGGSEDHMELLVDEGGQAERGCWNDVWGTATWQLGYVIEYPTAIFSDGFESGDTSAWSSSVP